MHTVKLTQIGDSLGVTLPNSDTLILSDEVLTVFRPKMGDTVLIVKHADSYRIRFNAMKAAGSVSVIKSSTGYYLSTNNKNQHFRQRKSIKIAKFLHNKTETLVKTHSSKVLTRPKPKLNQGENVLPLINNIIESNDPNIAEQLKLGREFMREFHETFQALAK